jgi:hypothetical protein
MKNKEVKEFIDKTIYEETKNILIEQFMPNKYNNNIIDKFKSLLPLSNNIKEVEQITDGTIINIGNVSPDVFMRTFNAKTQEEAESKLITALNGDLKQSEDENYDIDVNIESDGKFLTLKIMILTGEPLDDNDKQIEKNDTEMKENIKQNCTECDKNVSKKTFRLTEEKLVNLIEKMVMEVKKINKKNITYELLKENTVIINNKKIVRLTESQMKSVLDGLVLEAIPGLEAVKSVHNKSGSESSEHMNNVEKKLKKYLSFEGNDNPEFPNQINSGNKVAHRISNEDEEYIDDYRGGTPLDLEYDTEPSKKFKERAEKAIKGDSKMGNGQDATNVIKSKLGEKIIKKVNKKKKDIADDPMYKKDVQPINTKKSEKEHTALDESKQIRPIISEDIKKMKHIYSFNKSSQ